MRHFAVVGSGPAGFYTAEALVKAYGDQAQVDIIDRYPVPYGLIRFGVGGEQGEVMPHQVKRAFQPRRRASSAGGSPTIAPAAQARRPSPRGGAGQPRRA